MSRGPCLGDRLTALVDGALSHAERDRALAHVSRCDTCREEVEAQRALKARMTHLAEDVPPPPDRLTAALRGLAVPGVEPGAPHPPGPPVRPATVWSGTAPWAAVPRAPRRRAHRLRRAGAVGSGLLVAAVGAALVLGNQSSTASTPVDPASDAFVVDFVTTTGEVPLADPAGAVAVLPR